MRGIIGYPQTANKGLILMDLGIVQMLTQELLLNKLFQTIVEMIEIYQILEISEM